MFTSNKGFQFKGRHFKYDNRPYCISFKEIPRVGDISFWVKNKLLEVVAVKDEKHEILKSKYHSRGFLKGSSYVFFDHNENTIMEIRKGSLLKGHAVFLDKIEVGRVTPKKNQEFKRISLSIFSTSSSVEIISTKTAFSISDICIGYFCWLMFKRWDEMD